MSFRDVDTITVEEYVRLFSESQCMSYKTVVFLRCHLKCPDYMATMEELADAVGMANFKAANLHYGNFAKKLAMEFGWTEEDKRTHGFDWLYFLGTCRRQSLPPYQCVWALHPNVINALRKLGWSEINAIAL